MPTDSTIKLCVPAKVQSTPDGTQWKCSRCRFVDNDTAGHFPDRIYRTCDVQRLGLGDYIGLALARIGITKKRWSHWQMIRRFYWHRATKRDGMQWGEYVATFFRQCPCPQREQALNVAGWKWQDRVNRAGWWCKHRVAWIKSQFCKR